MFKRLYKYLLQNNILYEKQLAFQVSNLTEHVVIQLISKILDAFNENKYTPGIRCICIKGKNYYKISSPDLEDRD